MNREEAREEARADLRQSMIQAIRDKCPSDEDCEEMEQQFGRCTASHFMHWAVRDPTKIITIETDIEPLVDLLLDVIEDKATSYVRRKRQEQDQQDQETLNDPVFRASMEEAQRLMERKLTLAELQEQGWKVLRNKEEAP